MSKIRHLKIYYLRRSFTNTIFFFNFDNEKNNFLLRISIFTIFVEKNNDKLIFENNNVFVRVNETNSNKFRRRRSMNYNKRFLNVRRLIQKKTNKIFYEIFDAKTLLFSTEKK